MGGNGVTDLDMRIPANAGTARNAQRGDLAGRRAKIVVGVFGIDPALDRMPAHDDVFLAERQRHAGGDLDLLFDQVDAGDHLGDGVFDLDAGVDLDEIKVVVGVDQELACAGVDVTGGTGQPDGGFAELHAHGQRQGRCGRFFDQLLMPALQGAIAVPAMDDIAVRVGQDLDFDVPGAIDELFEVDAGVLERGLGFVTSGLKRGREIRLVAANAHALAAAAGGGLDQYGIADRAGQPRSPGRRW